MKKMNYGHRWTDDELKSLMASWTEGWSVDLIADNLNVSRPAVRKMVLKLRANGIPLPRRTHGNTAGRRNKPWTQEEVEYLVRRREQQATTEAIAVELGRTWSAVQGMIGTLRESGVPVKMLGCGVRRLWSPEKLRESAVGRELIAPEDPTQPLKLVA